MILKKLAISAVLTLAYASASQADIVYNSWTSNDGDTGNYIFTIGQSGGLFNFNLTVDPWNAEALGLFIDMGNVDLGAPVSISNVSTSPFAAGTVTLVGQDTTSDGCGAGCNLNGLFAPVASPDDEWEMVFRLGTQGFEGIKTFAWSTQDFGLSLSDFGVVGIRSQQLCSDGNTLDNGDTGCGGSDKAYGSSTPVDVPEPSSIALLAAGLIGLGAARRKKA